MGVSENLCSFLNDIKQLVLYAVEHGIAMEPMKEKWASCRVDLGYTELFCFPELTSVFCRLVTVILGTLWCSIKQIKAPYVCDWEHGIALHSMQGNQATSHGARDVSRFFSSCGENMGYIVKLRQ